MAGQDLPRPLNGGLDRVADEQGTVPQIERNAPVTELLLSRRWQRESPLARLEAISFNSNHMKIHHASLPLTITRLLSLVVGWLLSLPAPASFAGATSPEHFEGPPAGVFVHTALGGFILGYDIDQTGTEGFLCEALTLDDGKHNVAIETFDQRTGQIIKIVKELDDTNNDFVALGLTGQSVGLVELEKSRGLFVNQRRYSVLNPLDSNRLTGKWTPPLTKDEIIIGVSDDQGVATTAFMAFENGGSNSTFVFSSNVAANTFGSLITLDSGFSAFNSPVMDFDSATQEAIVAVLGSAFGPPLLAKVNLDTGATSEFTGVGVGFVNGIAVDPVTGTACTTTEIDFSVEFYDLATETGFAVPLPGATSQAQRGEAVAFDPINGLFLVGQPISSTAPSGSSIQVFDLQGNFVESINGLSLPASPTRIALHPTRRFGYVLVTPDLTSLQSFTY